MKGSFLDIDFLLVLQDLRQAAGPAPEVFFRLITSIVIPLAIGIGCWLYWCRDRRAGLLVLTSFSLGNLINQILKVTFCIYRPWVRDSRLKPSTKGAMATGYSFPSGHSQNASSVVFAVGRNFKNHGKWVSVLCITLVMLVGFSRLYLGVHTPQDVLVGIAEGAASVWLADRLLFLCERPGARHGLWLAGACLVCIAATLYAYLKPYPLDYVDGALLVNPAEMRRDCIVSCGLFFGLACGWYLERRFVRFNDDARRRERVARIVLGLAFIALGFFIAQAFKMVLGDGVPVQLTEGFLPMVGGLAAGPAAAQHFAAESGSPSNVDP